MLKSGLQFLIPYFQDKKYLLVAAMFLSFIGTLAGVISFLTRYYLLEPTFTRPLPAASLDKAVLLLLLTAVAGFLGKGAAIVCFYLAAYEILASIRKEFCSHLARVPMGFFTERSSGELKKVLTEDVERHFTLLSILC